MDWQTQTKLTPNGLLACGLDEAGRGPLAGPVFAAAVVLPQDLVIEGLNDSKKLSEKKREALFDTICARALDYAVASASEKEIDRINILNASLLAMRRAVDSLRRKPDFLLIDGNVARGFSIPARAVVKGDSLVPAIAAASILAKVSRDRYCVKLDRQYPEYGFAKHKGYPTALHYESLERFGPCDAHRLTFLKTFYERQGR